MELTLTNYNNYRQSMIMALMRYSHYKPTKLDRHLAEDVFQDAFFKYKELIEGTKLLKFRDFGAMESFVWRINRFTYLSMISSDNSKYKRGVPLYYYIEDLKGLQIIDIPDEEYVEVPQAKNFNSPLGLISNKILRSITNKKHRLYYKMYLDGYTMKQIADKHLLNVRSLEQQISRVNKSLEVKFGFKISKRKRK